MDREKATEELKPILKQLILWTGKHITAASSTEIIEKKRISLCIIGEYVNLFSTESDFDFTAADDAFRELLESNLPKGE